MYWRKSKFCGVPTRRGNGKVRSASGASRRCLGAMNSDDGNEYALYCATVGAQSALLSSHAPMLLKATAESTVHIYARGELVAGDGTTACDGQLDVARVQELLEARWVGRVVVYAPKVPSTQDVLRRVFPGMDAGTVAVAGVQTGGRGRRGTRWVSPVGSVCMSIAVRVPGAEPERLTFVQYLAALAVVEAMTGKGDDWTHIPIRIKWPNDIYVRGEKIGGVLCEATHRGDAFHVVVGIGVNVTNPAPTTCLLAALNAALDGHAARPTLTRERFLSRYLDAFERIFDAFNSRGFDEALRARYIAAWLHSGQLVTLGGPEGPEATIEGLAPNGWVRVRRHDLDAVQDLAPDVNSLDLVAGVIREKGDIGS